MRTPKSIELLVSTPIQFNDCDNIAAELLYYFAQPPHGLCVCVSAYRLLEATADYQ